MKYQCLFPGHSIEKEFEKFLRKIPQIKIRENIRQAVEKLSRDPRPFWSKSFKKIRPSIVYEQYAVDYRLRIGDYRVLYSIDDDKKIVWIIALKRRDNRTYKVLMF